MSIAAHKGSLVDVRAHLAELERRVADEGKTGPGRKGRTEDIEQRESKFKGENDGSNRIACVECRSTSQGDQDLPSRNDIGPLELDARSRQRLCDFGYTFKYDTIILTKETADLLLFAWK